MIFTPGSKRSSLVSSSTADKLDMLQQLHRTVEEDGSPSMCDTAPASTAAFGVRRPARRGSIDKPFSMASLKSKLKLMPSMQAHAFNSQEPNSPMLYTFPARGQVKSTRRSSVGFPSEGKLRTKSRDMTKHGLDSTLKSGPVCTT